MPFPRKAGAALLAAMSIALLTAAGLSAGASAHAGEPYTYRHVLDGSPIEVPRADLPAPVAAFHETGENPLVGAPDAVQAGQKIYRRICQACHLPDGSGRIGPNFLDDTWAYEATETMRGRFAIVYAGGAGAMQAFADRLSQLEILQVLAYVERLRDQAGD